MIEKPGWLPHSANASACAHGMALPEKDGKAVSVTKTNGLTASTSGHRLIGVWQQDSGKERRWVDGAAVQRCCVLAYPSCPLPLGHHWDINVQCPIALTVSVDLQCFAKMTLQLGCPTQAARAAWTGAQSFALPSPTAPCDSGVVTNPGPAGGDSSGPTPKARVLRDRRCAWLPLSPPP